MREKHDRRGRSGDAGFTLMELLVVLVIVGILAAMAAPAYLTQRAKAHDASTKADLDRLAKEISTYYVGGTGLLALDFSTLPGSVVLTDGQGFNSVLNLTNGTAAPSSGAYAHLDSPAEWCVSLTDAAGWVRDFSLSAANGLVEGTCA